MSRAHEQISCHRVSADCALWGVYDWEWHLRSKKMFLSVHGDLRLLERTPREEKMLPRSLLDVINDRMDLVCKGCGSDVHMQHDRTVYWQ